MVAALRLAVRDESGARARRRLASLLATMGALGTAPMDAARWPAYRERQT